jgi:hypothetical protein
MAILKVKISELPAAASLEGLYTIGYTNVSGKNESVKVSLAYLKIAVEKVAAAETATATANAAAAAASNAKNAASAAAQSATEAMQAATTATAAAREEIIIMEALRQQLVISAALVPTIMELSYPATVSIRNSGSPRIVARLLPVYALQNVLFLAAGGDAVTVLPDGRIVPNHTGNATVHVIPANATHLYKTVQISVRNPYLRKVSGGGLRITSSGHLRII